MGGCKGLHCPGCGSGHGPGPFLALLGVGALALCALARAVWMQRRAVEHAAVHLLVLAGEVLGVGAAVCAAVAVAVWRLRRRPHNRDARKRRDVSTRSRSRVFTRSRRGLPGRVARRDRGQATRHEPVALPLAAEGDGQRQPPGLRWAAVDEHVWLDAAVKIDKEGMN